VLAGYATSFTLLVLALMIEITVAGLVYFGLTLAFRITETHYMVGVMRRKWRGRVDQG
jgi:hypothetical protein